VGEETAAAAAADDDLEKPALKYTGYFKGVRNISSSW
jgi:hypothetical protein